MRLFFAAFPDVETRGRIEQAARALVLPDAAESVPAGKYHMTVMFLGEIAEQDLAAVREIATRQPAGSFMLRFGCCEYWSKARVVVAAANDCPEVLGQLRSGLESQLAERPIAFDAKPLRPHVTIARKVLQAPVLQAPWREISWMVRALHLVSSATGADSSVYTVVDTWPLLDIGADSPR